MASSAADLASAAVAALARDQLMRLLTLCLMTVLAGCAGVQPPHAWESRLRGDAIVLLGEVHDNAEQHRQRLAVLRRAFAAGWRPAVAMEQFDREHQADIDRARQEPGADAARVIAAAAPPAGKTGGNWNWDYYRPFVALALEFHVPLVAANLSAAQTSRVVREGYAAVFDAPTLHRLRLDQPVATDMQASQQQEIDEGHCNMLPAQLLPAMARAQFARDAVMADLITQHAARGAVLIAGNGHVRRDIGVARWLSGSLRARTFAVGYLERGASAARAAAFDAVVYTAPAQRSDPCVSLKKRFAK